jgi:hypothetical protein
VSHGDDPAKTSAVIFKNGCNNIYCRGLRIEGALSGGLYVEGGPIYVMGGKIDDGFGGPQSAPAVTIAAGSMLVLDDFYFGGMLNQFHIDVAGSLRLGKVALDGGTNSPAAINDRRAWSHINKATHPTYSAAYGGPFLPGIDLGEAQFHRYHPSVSTETPAAVYSKVHPIRQVRHLTIRANGIALGNAISVTTSLRDSHDGLYKGSFLVSNTTGVHRKILTSTATGMLVLEGIDPVATDADWSIEYCETHATPIRHASAWLDKGVALFAVVASPVTLTGVPAYISDPRDAAYGTTKIKITADALAVGRDLTGLFLVDDFPGDAYYIEYGLDAQGYVGLIYDRRTALDGAHDFRLVAGHAASAAMERTQLIRQVATDVPIAPDLSKGNQLEITVTSPGVLAISSPVRMTASPGQRIALTIINKTCSDLGEVSWAAVYKLAPWASLSRGHSRSIDFRYNGKNWIEVARTPLDVPS